MSDKVLRSVYPAYCAELVQFLSGDLARRMVENGALVPSEIIRSDEEGVVIQHPRISFISYAWEWPPSLWQAAAEHTLTICEQLIADNWILKDATPQNILFQATKPILVDILSVQKLGDKPMWLAYAQFVRTFLLPMIAYAELGWPLAATQIRRDGIEPEELYEALPWVRRFRRRTLTGVTLPTLLAKTRLAQESLDQAVHVQDPESVQRILLTTVRSLRRTVRLSRSRQKQSRWSGYREQAVHYQTAEHVMKQRFVSEALLHCKPVSVLDVGCNSGVYSNLAADAGAEVIAIDTDVMALERLCEEVQASGRNILPLHVDLARPTPATGWCNREDLSFLSRCEGRFDTVMMLAVLHHLLLGSQIPMQEIAVLVSRLATRHLIIEWVPPSDVRFKEILRGRDAIYGHVTEAAFRNEFATFFSVERETPLDNGRIMFLMRRR